MTALKAVREARNLRQRIVGAKTRLTMMPLPATAIVAVVIDEFVARYVRNPRDPLRDRTADDSKARSNGS